MTNQPEEIEEEKTVPVPTMTNRELTVVDKAYRGYVAECRANGGSPVSYRQWMRDEGLIF